MVGDDKNFTTALGFAARALKQMRTVVVRVLAFVERELKIMRTMVVHQQLHLHPVEPVVKVQPRFMVNLDPVEPVVKPHPRLLVNLLLAAPVAHHTFHPLQILG